MTRITANNPTTLALIFTAGLFSACGSGTGESRQVPITPTSPSGGSSGPVTLTAPTPVSPVNGEQTSTLRPVLTVQNGTSTQQSGTRTYEFQVSDGADFSIGSSLTSTFLVSVSQTGVAEGSDGRTAFTVNQDLQPTTRMYWRARVVQGTSTSSWSSPSMFRTKLMGYNRGGELYDPLIHSETIGTIFGAHTWVPGKGLRLETENSYVQYLLAETLANGEFSVEVEGLRPNGPDHKLKIFSMSDSTGDITNSPFQMSTMYRGLNGNPPNCIAFKAVFGSQSRIVEPNRSQRDAGIRSLDSGRTYFWKATWGSEFRLLVLDGGINGSPIYELGIGASGGTYRPSPPYAFLGSNQSVYGSDAGTFPGATYRNLFIGNKSRPTTLGNALD
jgi:hypothetical protein